jgi:cathepsin L
LWDLGGLASEWTYPYISYFGNNYQCQLNKSRPAVASLSGWTVLPSNSYLPVLTAVATGGPLVLPLFSMPPSLMPHKAINVDASSWSSYESGVYNGCNQTNPDIDHVVQLVGYGTDPTYGDYWLVRNSWY